MNKITRLAVATATTVLASTAIALPQATAATNPSGANVTTAEATHTGFVAGGGHVSTHELDGVAERLTEDLGWYGGQQISQRRALQHNWTIGDVAAGGKTLQIVARKADTDAEPYTFMFDPNTGGGRHSVCTITTTAWTTCELTLVTGAGALDLALNDGWAVDQLANAIEVDYIGLAASTDVTAPTVAITSPTAGASVTGYVNIEATATDDRAVSFVDFYAGATRITRDSTAPFTAMWNAATAPAGSHTLSAQAYDASGNVGTSSVDVDLVADTTAPTGAITSPANGATVSDVVMVTANASDNNSVSRVAFLVDGQGFAEDYSAPFTAAWLSDEVADGAHQLSIQIYDPSGNVTTSAITVNVNNAVVAPPAPATGTLTVKASGRSGTAITSNPVGISVTSGSSRSATFTVGQQVKLTVGSGRTATFTGACSSGGRKVTSCTFTFTGNSTVTGNIA